MLFFWTLYSLKNPEGFIVSTKILSSTTVFNIDNNRKCFKQRMICDFWWFQFFFMISVGSCDTEDWSNDAENSAFPSQE